MSTNSELKEVVIMGVSEIPAVGEFIAPLVDLLWKTEDADNSHWKQLREQTERLLNTKLDIEAWNRLDSTLAGLKQVLDDYTAAANQGETHDLYVNYITTRTDFLQNMPSFQQKPHELLLLPLFAQAATLLLTLLRDGNLHGAEMMKMTTEDAKRNEELTKKCLAEFQKYVADTFRTVRNHQTLDEMDPRDQFVSQMTLDVEDYVQLWPYFAPDSPGPIGPVLTRELCSPILGAFHVIPTPPPTEAKDGIYPSPPPSARPTRIRFFGSDTFVLGTIAVAYDGEDWPRMGRQATIGGAKADLRMDELVVAHGELVSIGVNSSFEGVHGLGFYFADGYWVGSDLKSGPAHWSLLHVPEDHYLSSINVVSRYKDAQRGVLVNDLIRTLWFGFRFRPGLRGGGRTLYWTRLNGAASDIAVGIRGDVWCVGTDRQPYRWSAGGWQVVDWHVDGALAKIAVSPNGLPWAVNDSGQIYRRTGDGPSGDKWERVIGTATEIAIGGDASVWIIDGSHRLATWDGAAWTVVSESDRTLSRVAVGPDGIPWAITAEGSIVKWTIKRPAGRRWAEMPSKGQEVSAGGDGRVWITDDGGGTWYWNGTRWAWGGGANVKRLAAGPGGTVWACAEDGAIWRGR